MMNCFKSKKKLFVVKFWDYYVPFFRTTSRFPGTFMPGIFLVLNSRT